MEDWITVDDKFPIPNIENILDKLCRAQYFTTIDLAKGFQQILVKQKDRMKTASIRSIFNRMPFGHVRLPHFKDSLTLC